MVNIYLKRIVWSSLFKLNRLFVCSELKSRKMSMNASVVRSKE